MAASNQHVYELTTIHNQALFEDCLVVVSSFDLARRVNAQSYLQRISDPDDFNRESVFEIVFAPLAEPFTDVDLDVRIRLQKLFKSTSVVPVFMRQNGVLNFRWIDVQSLHILQQDSTVGEGVEQDVLTDEERKAPKSQGVLKFR
jgi:hypothetical protein